MRLKTSFTAVAIVLSIGAALPASAGSRGSFVGDTKDPVTGYPCATRFCDTIRLPNTDCLCQKENPTETRLQNLRLTSIDMTTRQQCPVSPFPPRLAFSKDQLRQAQFLARIDQVRVAAQRRVGVEDLAVALARTEPLLCDRP